MSWQDCSEMDWLSVCAVLVLDQLGAHGFDFGLHGDVSLFLVDELVARELRLGGNVSELIY